jgi:hypothetical protein
MSDRKRHKDGTVERKLEELKAKLSNHVPTREEAQRASQFLRDEATTGAMDQIARGIPNGIGICSGVERQLSAASLYHTFCASDGQESALSRLIVMMTEGAASCAERAVTADGPTRAVEFNLASKLCLTAAALSDALDRHRTRKLPKYIDGSVGEAAKK